MKAKNGFPALTGSEFLLNKEIKNVPISSQMLMVQFSNGIRFENFECMESNNKLTH